MINKKSFNDGLDAQFEGKWELVSKPWIITERWVAGNTACWCREEVGKDSSL